MISIHWVIYLKAGIFILSLAFKYKYYAVRIIVYMM